MFNDYFFSLQYLGDVVPLPPHAVITALALYTDTLCWRDKVKLHEVLVPEVRNVIE